MKADKEINLRGKNAVVKINTKNRDIFKVQLLDKNYDIIGRKSDKFNGLLLQKMFWNMENNKSNKNSQSMVQSKKNKSKNKLNKKPKNKYKNNSKNKST